MIKQLWNSIPYKLRFALEMIGGTILALGFIGSIYMFCIVLCAMSDKCWNFYFPMQ